MIFVFLLLQTTPSSPPVDIDVDLSTLAPGDPTSAVETDYIEIYSSVARILHVGGYRIIAPKKEANLDTELLDTAGVPTVARGGPSSTLLLEFSSPDIARGIYRIHISARRPDGSREALPPMTCGPNCPPDEVENFLEARKMSIFALLESQQPTTTTTADLRTHDRSDNPEVTPPVSPRLGPTAAPSKERPLGPVGITGIVMGGLGLGGFIWGSTNFGLDRARDSKHHGLETFQRDRYFNAGTGAVWGAGAALLIAGGTMLLIEQTVLKKRARRANRDLSSVGIIPGFSFSF